jgi:hypothetical protein
MFVFYVDSEDVGSIKGTSDKQSTVAICFLSFKLQQAVVNSFCTGVTSVGMKWHLHI